ncbi:MAG: hypothetical protein HYX87_05950, partial [Chloroflexi bacterium]|nr:hypothetical protein [Chloroflexota bacterium]
KVEATPQLLDDLLQLDLVSLVDLPPLPPVEDAFDLFLKDLIHQSSLDIKDEGRVFESYSFCVNFPHDDIAKEPPTSSEIDSHYQRLKRIKENYLSR